MNNRNNKRLKSIIVQRIPVISVVIILVCGTAYAKPAQGSDETKKADVKKIVLLAGPRSHGPGVHDYDRDLKLLKHCLDTSPNLKGVKTELHLKGWPDDPSTLDNADTIVLFSDGSDHDESKHPLLLGDRMKVLAKQMARGCGLMVQHYSTFAPKRFGKKYLEWVGGYFDYETGNNPGKANKSKWYSDIGWATATLTPGTLAHPTLRGVGPFTHREEYYYNIRFRANDPRLSPIWTVKIPGLAEAQTVAWAVERADGGRGFATTCGHAHDSFKKLSQYRKLHLNAIVWTAGMDVPVGGVESTLPADNKSKDAAARKAERPIRALILTGDHHPGHPWKPSTEALQKVLSHDPRYRVDVATDPNKLADMPLTGYDLIVQNYCNWQKPCLADKARAALAKYISDGGGLVISHFANGAFGPGARPPQADDIWPEYCGKICRRIWVDGKSAHDAYGPFHVDITTLKHEITDGLKGFDTIDELYYNQQGDEAIEPLVTAKSKQSGKDEPLVFAYMYGKGRVFQNLLGHSVESLTNPGAAALMLRGSTWAAGRPQSPRSPDAFRQTHDAKLFGRALDASEETICVEPRDAYAKPPLTVECWAKTSNRKEFNIFVANDPKASPAHWEIYSYVGTGALSFYMPGYDPAEVKSTCNIAEGQWHYLAVTFDGQVVKLYADGRSVARVKVEPKRPIVRKPGPLCIGHADAGKIMVGCKGQVDEVRISNCIRNIESVPSAPFTADAKTIGLWHLDDDPNKMQYDDASALKNRASPGGFVSPEEMQGIMRINE